VDTPEDLELITKIFTRIDDRDNFTWLDVLAIFEREPDLKRINAQVEAKSVTEIGPSVNNSTLIGNQEE
jgi:spore coat polysaccharide biosynthesis protein SpsF (cytidylyltransferase family)